jgi:ATP-dependent RNA helicase DBP3
MPPAAAATARAERSTAVEGCGLPPVLSFAQTGLSADLLHSTREFATPSPIQAQCWPIVLSGYDLIGIAATGSGKTLGFGLPMMAHISANKRPGGAAAGKKGPFAVVLAPTRELALQIAAVLEDAGSRCGVRCVCVYGGVPKGPQVQALKAGVEVIVGTPGRLEDLMEDGIANLKVGARGPGRGGGGQAACTPGGRSIQNAWMKGRCARAAEGGRGVAVAVLQTARVCCA